MKDITCCKYHTTYLVPLIETKRFDGFRLWCPHCGSKYKSNILDSQIHPKSLLLGIRYKFFKHTSKSLLKNESVEYLYYSKPDSVFVSMSDADIALTMFNLGYRYKPEDLVDGSVLYTLTKNKITVVNLNGVLCIQNQEKTQTKLISDAKGYDLALLPDAEFVSNFFIKAMDL